MESKLSISSALSVDTIIARLRTSTINTKKQTQANYQQIFLGEVDNDSAEITDFYATPRNKVLYKIQVNASKNNLTNILISNNKFEHRQFTNSLLKAFLLPFGFILLIVSFITIQDSDMFLFGLTSGAISILIPLLYKLVPLSENEFLSDHVVKNILKLLDPIEIKLLVN